MSQSDFITADLNFLANKLAATADNSMDVGDVATTAHLDFLAKELAAANTSMDVGDVATTANLDFLAKELAAANNSMDVGGVATANSDFLADELSGVDYYMDGTDDSMDDKSVSSFALFGELCCPVDDNASNDSDVGGARATPCRTIRKQPRHSRKRCVTQCSYSFDPLGKQVQPVLKYVAPPGSHGVF
jgi:hypothetical protein